MERLRATTDRSNSRFWDSGEKGDQQLDSIEVWDAGEVEELCDAGFLLGRK